jgi:NADPH:quinone reductase-like Zn-dependent oxidoreductase
MLYCRFERTVFQYEGISFREVAIDRSMTPSSACVARKAPPSKKVLITRASGRVDTLPCGSKTAWRGVATGLHRANAELMKSLGVDRVIDYHEQDFTKSGGGYDIIFDVVSSRSFGDCKKALTSNGVYINTLPSASIYWSIFATSLLPGKKAATIMSASSANMDWQCVHISRKLKSFSTESIAGAGGALSYSRQEVREKW